MSGPLVIVGSGGMAMESCWLAQECGWSPIGFLDDNSAARGKEVLGLPVVGTSADWRKFPGAAFVVAIGLPRDRRSVVRQMSSVGTPRFATLVHPSVRVSQFVTLGEGTIVASNCVLTVDIVVGRHAILNMGATIAHECRLADFVTVGPLAAISGKVRLDECVDVGAGASIRQGQTMGPGSVLGMGGVLTKPIGASEVFVGNPAKLLRTLRD